MGITFEIRAASHLAPRSGFPEIRTQNVCLLRAYFGFLGIPGAVGDRAPAGRLVIIRIHEIRDGNNISVPCDIPSRPRTVFSQIRTQNILRAYFGFLGIPGPVGDRAPAGRSVITRIHEIRDGNNISVPSDISSRR